MIESPKELRKICQPKLKVSQESWMMRYVRRRISVYITWLFLHTPITANQVSLLTLLTGLLAGILLGFGTLLTMIIGGIVLNFADVLDCVDGEVARYRKKTSIEGIYIDVLCEYMSEIVAIAGFVCGVYRAIGQIWVLYIGLSFLLFYIACKEIKIRIFYTAFLRNKKAYEKGEPLSGLVLPPQDIGFLMSPKIFRMGTIHILILIVCLFDGVISLAGFSGSIISMRLLLVIFYGVLLPISFFWKLYKIITTKAVTNWFMAEDKKKATDD